jgi:hypothetical protein
MLSYFFNLHLEKSVFQYATSNHTVQFVKNASFIPRWLNKIIFILFQNVKQHVSIIIWISDIKFWDTLSSFGKQELYLLLHFYALNRDRAIGFEEEGLVNIVNLFSHISTEYTQFPSYSANNYTKFPLTQIQVFTCTLHSCLQIYWTLFFINL